MTSIPMTGVFRDNEQPHTFESLRLMKDTHGVGQSEDSNTVDMEMFQ